jgi:threonine dehydrogenase-like Zn-dependent dehydrogenase
VCKPASGCVTTTKTCNDNNLCTTDKCDPVFPGGCVYTNITCPNYADPCLITYCDPLNGCLNKTNIEELPVCTNLTAGNCSQVKCANKTCFLQYYCLTPPPTSSEEFPTNTVILASSITGAAIAGIVIAGVVLVVGLGGGAAVAIAGAAGAGGVVSVQSNPLYSGAGTSGTNPLAQDS